MFDSKKNCDIGKRVYVAVLISHGAGRISGISHLPGGFFYRYRLQDLEVRMPRFSVVWSVPGFFCEWDTLCVCVYALTGVSLSHLSDAKCFEALDGNFFK